MKKLVSESIWVNLLFSLPHLIKCIVKEKIKAPISTMNTYDTYYLINSLKKAGSIGEKKSSLINNSPTSPAYIIYALLKRISPISSTYIY